MSKKRNVKSAKRLFKALADCRSVTESDEQEIHAMYVSNKCFPRQECWRDFSSISRFALIKATNCCASS